MSNILMRPRNDFVLIRIVNVGKVGQIAVSDLSVAGKEFHVVAVGPEVEDLKAGDQVLMLGSKNSTYWELPNDSSLIVMKQEHVALVINDVSDSVRVLDPKKNAEPHHVEVMT